MEGVIEGLNWSFILACGLLGMLGQFIRSIVGIYKIVMDDSIDTASALKKKRFVMSLLLGFLVGLIACLIFDQPLSKTDIMGIIGGGYMGVDFIEGILIKRGSAIK